MKYIKLIRKKIGLTQLEVSQQIGITERAYQRIESGGSTPNVVLARRLANVLNVSIDDLFINEKDSDNDSLDKTEKKLYDVNEFCTLILNNKISKSTIYAKIKTGEIKAIKIGRKPLIPAWFVEELLTSHNI